MSLLPGHTYHDVYGYPWRWALLAEVAWRMEHWRRLSPPWSYGWRKAAERRGSPVTRADRKISDRRADRDRRRLIAIDAEYARRPLPDRTRRKWNTIVERAMRVGRLHHDERHVIRAEGVDAMAEKRLRDFGGRCFAWLACVASVPIGATIATVVDDHGAGYAVAACIASVAVGGSAGGWALWSWWKTS